MDKIKEKNNKLYDSLSANITAPTKSFVNQADDYLKDLIKKYPSDFDMVYTLFTDKYGRFQNSYL
ncbi:hypothetical protein J6T66_00120 [bacterium]|nr:hypothetical protein [bacterium]